MTDEPGPVLVVDDDGDWRALLVDALGIARVEVIACASGDDALRVATRVRPRLVVTDLHMPGMSGDELARRLSALSPAPVLLGLTGDADAARAAWPEFHALMSKPASPLDVAAMVVRLSRLMPRDTRAPRRGEQKTR